MHSKFSMNIVILGALKIQITEVQISDFLLQLLFKTTSLIFRKKLLCKF